MTTNENAIPKFKIKLLSGQNVVLVECPGYESELFMPQIMEERIIFRNIIPNRCCCSAAECPIPLIFNSPTDQADGSVCSSKSTPVVSTKAPTRVIGGKENKIGSTKKQQPSPQMIRSQLNEQANELREHLTPLYKVDSVHFPKPNLECLINQLSSLPDAADPKKINTSTTKSATPTTNMQNDSAYNLPVTPDNRESLKSRNTTAESLNKKLRPTDSWFKCLTPVHTYSRTKNSSSTVSSSTTSGPTAKPAFNTSPVRKKPKRSTKPPHPVMKLEIHKRKIIIDKKKSLTAADMKQNDYMTMIKKKTKKVPSAKNRKQLEAIKLTSLDLLTTPSQSNGSNKLKKQFKNALCKKASSTHPVCKDLAEMPPMRMDKQVQQIQRKHSYKKITRPTTTTTKTAAAVAAVTRSKAAEAATTSKAAEAATTSKAAEAATTSAELATVAAASAIKATSSKAMELIGNPVTITRTSPLPAKSFAVAKAKIAALSKTVAAMTAAAAVGRQATLKVASTSQVTSTTAERA